MDLKTALSEMDSMDNEQWTQDGAPKLDYLKSIIGQDVSRQDVVDAAPQFNRKNMVIGTPDPEEQENDDEFMLDDVEEEFTFDEYLMADHPMPYRDFLEYLGSVPAEYLPTFEKIIEQQMAGADEARAKADEIYKSMKYLKGVTSVRVKQLVPNISNGEAIRDYIESQAKNRAGRYAKIKEIKDQIGVDISKLDPRSTIDRAMARKTGRGGKRPIRQMK